jgi:hypothetical protein
LVLLTIDRENIPRVTTDFQEQSWAGRKFIVGSGRYGAHPYFLAENKGFGWTTGEVMVDKLARKTKKFFAAILKMNCSGNN